MKHTDKNGVNKQNTHTPNTQRKILLERVSQYENKRYSQFISKKPPKKLL